MGETKACVKCGLVDGGVGSWYNMGSTVAPSQPARRAWCRRLVAPPSDRPSALPSCRAWVTEATKDLVSGEHIDVTCAGCGYCYAEPCKDAK